MSALIQYDWPDREDRPELLRQVREYCRELHYLVTIDDLEVVYMWVDGVYVKAGLEKEKAAVLVVMAALSDGSKVVVSAVPGYRESTENWSEVLSIR